LLVAATPVKRKSGGHSHFLNEGGKTLSAKMRITVIMPLEAHLSRTYYLRQILRVVILRISALIRSASFFASSLRKSFQSSLRDLLFRLESCMVIYRLQIYSWDSGCISEAYQCFSLAFTNLSQMSAQKCPSPPVTYLGTSMVPLKTAGNSEEVLCTNSSQFSTK
jgi:hypothetical protein